MRTYQLKGKQGGGGGGGCGGGFARSGVDKDQLEKCAFSNRRGYIFILDFGSTAQ